MNEEMDDNMKKIFLLIILTLSMVPYGHSVEQSSPMYKELLETAAKFSPTVFCTQNCNQLIATGITGLTTWTILPYFSFSCQYNSSQGGKRMSEFNFLFNGDEPQQKTKYIIPPLMIALIAAGIYGVANR